jgi:hypothetical protein
MISAASIIFLLRFSPTTKSIIVTSRWCSLISVSSNVMKSLWLWTSNINSKASLLVIYSGVYNLEALYELLLSSTWTSFRLSFCTSVLSSTLNPEFSCSFISSLCKHVSPVIFGGDRFYGSVGISPCTQSLIFLIIISVPQFFFLEWNAITSV